MSLLSPLAFLWLVSVPVLLWLWRFAAARHRTLVPSLVPFEHLLRRPPTRRTRLIVNALFWLQLAALALIALALAEPALLGRQPRTLLVLLDTSASMGATVGGASPFERAKRELLARLGRKGPGERVFVVSTAPIAALTQEPLTEASELGRLVQALAPVELGGNLSLARRIGESLLGNRPDSTLVLTDEPPPDTADPDVEFRSFGEALPNVAIVGLDAHEPLCVPTAAQLLVTVQNVADIEQEVMVFVRHNGQPIAHTSHVLPPQGRSPISLSLPDGSTGLFEVGLSAKHDALSVDNRAFVTVRGTEAIPVVAASARPLFLETIGRWLDACPRVAWTPMPLEGVPAETGRAQGLAADVLVTDDAQLAATWPSATMLFGQQTQGKPILFTRWLVDPAHPISNYLQPLEAVAAATAPLAPPGPWGDPIIWGVAEGRKVPLVRAASTQERRMVGLLFDPTVSPSSVPSVLVFLNSLRWLTSSLGLVTTGEALLVGPFEPGLVRIQPPRGVGQARTQEGGWLRYNSTEQAGRYRFMQGQRMIERVVNFLDPVESNTMQRVSTWGAAAGLAPSSVVSETPRQSLVDWLLGCLVIILWLEWILYIRKWWK